MPGRPGACCLLWGHEEGGCWKWGKKGTALGTQRGEAASEQRQRKSRVWGCELHPIPMLIWSRMVSIGWFPRPAPDYCCATRSLAGEKLQIYHGRVGGAAPGCDSLRGGRHAARGGDTASSAVPVPRAGAGQSPDCSTHPDPEFTTQPGGAWRPSKSSPCSTCRRCSLRCQLQSTCKRLPQITLTLSALLLPQKHLFFPN